MKIICGGFYMLLMLASCSQATDRAQKKAPFDKKESAPLPIPASGKVAQVAILSDSTQRYSLFVPASADSNSMLLIFFDPGAKGAKPVEKYKALAERHGIMLAGSLNSKNGMSGEESAAIARILVKDLKARLHVKQENIYACGFSGGARVAVLTAIGENLKGAIGCGAGFPGKPDKSYGFTYVGMVGNEDFNYLEMKRLYQDLERVKMKHRLLIFDGRHEWAPEAEMEKALLSLRNDAAAVRALTGKIDSAALVFQNKKDWLRLYDELMLGITGSFDSASVREWKKEMQALKKNPSCVAMMKSEAEIETEEAVAQGELAKAFAEGNFPLLAEKIKSLSNDAAGKSSLQKLSNQRLLQFISLMGFLYSEKALAGELALAKKYLDIYGKADWNNHDYHYLLACYHAKSSDKQKALAELGKAVELGFDDAEKLRTDRVLQVLQQEPAYTDLMRKLQMPASN